MVKILMIPALLAVATTTFVCAQNQELPQLMLLTQPPTPNITAPITLEQALQQAYMLNPTLKAAAYNVRAAEFTKKAAWGVHLPQIGVTANYTYMSQDVGHFDFNAQKNKVADFISALPIPLPPDIITSLRGMDLSYTLQKRDFAVVGANIAIPIYTGGKLNAVSNAGKIRFEQAKVEQKQALHNIFTQVSEQYWGLALAQNVEQLQGQLVKALEVHLSYASQLEANGLIAKGERLFVEMNLSQARAALLSAQGVSSTVNSALGGSLTDKLQISSTQSLSYEPVTPLFIASYVEPLAHFKELAVKNSLALEQVELIKKLSFELVRAERADFVPQVAAIGGYNIWNYQLSKEVPQWFAGAVIKWSIFDGLQREFKYSAARNQVRRLEQLEIKAQSDIQVLVEKLYTEMLSAREQVAASASTIAFAKEFLKIKSEAFKEGLVPARDVIDAELNLSKAYTERMAAAYKFDITLANLLAITGQAEQFADYQNSTTSFIISCEK